MCFHCKMNDKVFTLAKAGKLASVIFSLIQRRHLRAYLQFYTKKLDMCCCAPTDSSHNAVLLIFSPKLCNANIGSFFLYIHWGRAEFVTFASMVIGDNILQCEHFVIFVVFCFFFFFFKQGREHQRYYCSRLSFFMRKISCFLVKRWRFEATKMAQGSRGPQKLLKPQRLEMFHHSILSEEQEVI